MRTDSEAKIATSNSSPDADTATDQAQPDRPGPVPVSRSLSIEDARRKLTSSLNGKRPSLSPVEAAFLHALLIDDPDLGDEEEHATHMNRAAERLDDDTLFTLPPSPCPPPKKVPVSSCSSSSTFTNGNETTRATTSPADVGEFPASGDVARRSSRGPSKAKRPFEPILSLWRAFEDGVKPRALIETHEKLLTGKQTQDRDKNDEDEKHEDAASMQALADPLDMAGSIRTDDEVRIDKTTGTTTTTTTNDDASSWDEEDGGFVHFDAWEVLKDEYAEDFGFCYNHRSSREEREADEENRDGDGTKATNGRSHNTFKILGTSAQDVAAHPHVLSPPLMDALMNHMPFVLKDENYWLKFSLVRDGACLQTLKRYARAATHTVLAIETADGRVFGSFTTCPWRTNVGYYGTGRDSFLWKMKQSRNKKCYSLLQQAKMEHEIDVYPFSGANTMVQLCTTNRIAIGGGKVNQTHADSLAETNSDHENCREEGGFGLAINDDLLDGTSSPCATYDNPSLVTSDTSSHGDVFKVVNLEVWALTPCFTEDSAERLEMTKFFIEESSRSLPGNASSGSLGSELHYVSGRTMNQHDFYKRVGVK